MRPTEARWIAGRIAALGSACSPLLNVGSSTAEFRRTRQPHIETLVFEPLRSSGVEVVHTDIKLGEGVDIAGDVMDEHVRQQIRAARPRAVLCSNLLEHVPQREALASAIRELVEPGGYLIVTVPRSYPFHADPIDTGFRPSPGELAALFPRTSLVEGEVVKDTTYARELVSQPLRKSIRSLLGAMRPTGDAARSQRDRLRWLFREFSTSCVVLRAV
jgi:hypothetical protein